MAADVATIMHADMDAFYAAVEQHDRPELRGKPVIVGATSPRGVVLTASYEARVFGVHSAMPGVHAHRLCPNGVFVPPRMARYATVAREIRRVFEEFTPLVEPLSLDEAFLDVSGSLRLFGPPERIGTRLKQRVRETTGLTASVGIGPTKTVAKIASAHCKPDGLLVVALAAVDTFLRPLPVGQLWGVGPKLQATLTRMRIATIGDLADRDPTLLERRLGTFAPILWEMAHGRDRRLVDPERQRKSCGEECTFDRDQRDGALLRRTIIDHADAIAHRLRADGYRGRTVTLKLKLAQRIGPGKYPILTRSVTLPAAVDDGKSISDAALALWDAVKPGRIVRLIGVSVSGIDTDAAAQLSLFEAPATQRRAALNRAVDSLVARFGHDAIQRGTARRRR